MIAGVACFALGAAAGGILGAIAGGLVADASAAEEAACLRARLDAAGARADAAAGRCRELSAELSRSAAVALDMLSQIEEDDRALGTGHATRYRARMRGSVLP